VNVTFVSSLTDPVGKLLVGWQEGHPAGKKIEWWGVGMVICLKRGADLHTDASATHCLLLQ